MRHRYLQIEYSIELSSQGRFWRSACTTMNALVSHFRRTRSSSYALMPHISHSQKRRAGNAYSLENVPLQQSEPSHSLDFLPFFIVRKRIFPPSFSVVRILALHSLLVRGRKEPLERKEEIIPASHSTRNTKRNMCVRCWKDRIR